MNAEPPRLSAGAAFLAAKHAQTGEQKEWVGKVVGYPASQHGAFYATLPFAAIYTDERWWLAAAQNPPPSQHPDDITAYDPDDADVLLYDPVTNDARIWHVETPTLFRPDDYAPTSIVIYTAPRAFLHAWANARAAHAAQVAQLPQNERVALHEPASGFMPGALVVGSISRIRWHGMPRKVIVIDDKDVERAARAVQRMIDRDANTPRVSTTPDSDDAA